MRGKLSSEMSRVASREMYASARAERSRFFFFFPAVAKFRSGASVGETTASVTPIGTLLKPDGFGEGTGNAIAPP